MADLKAESCTGTIRRCKRKRQQSPVPETSEEERIENDDSDKVEKPGQKKILSTGGVWKNLDLALYFQNKDLSPWSKIALAFEFVSSTSEADSDENSLEPLQVSNLASFLGVQVQSLMMSKYSDGSDPCMDTRFWVVLRFCLEKAYFRISENFLSLVNRVLSHRLPGDGNDALHVDVSAGFHENVLECLRLLFSSHGNSVNNTHINLWISCVSITVKLIVGIFSQNNHDLSHSNVLLQLSCLLLVQFARFLKVHPKPKQMFLLFVDSLLESILESMVMLHFRIQNNGCQFERDLMGVLEDILSNGLFHSHPAHISGFLSLRSSRSTKEKHKSKRFKGVYQRNLFEKVKRIITEKKYMPMTGIGDLLQLFVRNVKKNENVYLEHYSSQKNEVHETTLKKQEVQKTTSPMFEVFMLFMEPLVDISECEFDLVEVRYRVQSINRLLAILMREKLYAPIEDIDTGVNFTFLKEVYNTVCCICEKVYQLTLPKLNVDVAGSETMVTLMIKEFIICLGYFLEIEYKVVGDDLVPMWLMILSSLSIYLSIEEKNQGDLMIPEIFSLGGQTTKLFTDLRQVNGSPIFALCKAVRFFISGKVGEQYHSLFISCRYLSSQNRLKAVAKLLLSKELRSATFNALKYIPEGQVSTYIEQLNLEIAESLEWIKFLASGLFGRGQQDDDVLSNITNFNSQTEVLGILSEHYSILLNSMMVTTGNSNSVGKAIEDIINILTSIFTSLTVSKSSGLDEFLCLIFGRKIPEPGMPATINLGASWIFVFLFHIYICCRSLYKQVISLMPKDARKAAASIGNVFTACHGQDWFWKTKFKNKNYFSWIVGKSTSLTDVIHIIRSLFPRHKIDHAPLVYILHTMILQRLVELNSQVKGFVFLCDREERLVKNCKLDSDGDSRKRKKEKRMQVTELLKQEAMDLTNFMIDYLPLKKISRWNKMCADNQTWDLCACSLSEKSLPVATWWLLCQNIDVWCGYTASKKLKKFMSLAIYSASQSINKCGSSEEVYSSGLMTIGLISSELLMNTVLYEQENLSKHLMSGFACAFKKLLSPSASCADAMNMEFEVLPDWKKIEKILERETRSLLQKKTGIGPSPLGIDNTLFTTFFLGVIDANKASGIEKLLKLLCRVIQIHTTSSSVSLLILYILNMERFVVSTLIKCHEEHLSCNCFELLGLFVSCRRTLRYMALASSTEGFVDKTPPLLQVLNENILSIGWLFKSVAAVVALPYQLFGEKNHFQTKELFYILMDHTSYIFFLMTKGILFVTISDMNRDVNPAEISSNGSVESDSVEQIDTLKELGHVVSKLKKETENLQIIQKNFSVIELEADDSIVSWNWLSCIVSCFQGFLWGLEFTSSQLEKLSMDKTQGFMDSCIYKFYSYTNIFEDFVNAFLNLLLINVNRTDFSLACDENSSASSAKSPSIKKNKPSGVETTKTNIIDLHLPDLSNFHRFHGTLFRKLLEGENDTLVFLIRQVFISSAAIMKLKHILPYPTSLSSKIKFTISETNSTSTLLKTAFYFLLEFSKSSGIPVPFSYVWLDGIIIYLKEINHHISHSDPVLTKDVYAKIVDIHLKAIGKCISLQGRAATLASHETGSNTKLLHSARESCETNLSRSFNKKCTLDEFKSRLRMSFRKLVMRPLRPHIVSAVLALERSLVGVQQDCSIIYDITTGNVDGGRVSETVAAAVDCLDLVLEMVLGKQQLIVIERHIQNFVSALFNITFHLHTPVIFQKVTLPRSTCDIHPDAGAVILMCVEVLTKVAGKSDMFELNSCLISQSLHLPTMLFHDFHHLFVSMIQSNMTTISVAIDKQFSVDLYAACCKLLCTTLRHHKRECLRCIALLEDSVNVLLMCLETVNADFTNKEDSLSWSTPETVMCATFLRRVYEEMGQQKGLLGRYSSHFLSTYISISSRMGPFKSGIKREIEEALEPGVFALMGICEASDLQVVHTVLGEGPCRKRLADLQRDYKLKFQYEGKI